MATATTPVAQTEWTVLCEVDGCKYVTVREHWRARPHEGGSEYKPVNVCKHLRCINPDGTVSNLGWAAKSGEISAKLVEAMAQVINVTGFPKSHKWTLEEAEYVLSRGMRYKKGKWYWQDGKTQRFFNRRISETMYSINGVLEYRARNQGLRK